MLKSFVNHLLSYWVSNMENRIFEERVFKIPRFQKNYMKMLDEAILNDFNSVKPIDVHVDPLIEWGYILTCASIFALSQIDDYQVVALRIASSCVTSKNSQKEHKVAAAFIFNRLTTNPAVTLAIKRKLIPANAFKNLPVPLLLDRLKSDFKSTVVRGEEVIYLNRFQMNLYSSLEESSWISISAPTSAGKSYILEKVIEDYFIQNRKLNVCFLVPTRALISQVESDLMINFIKSRLGRVYMSSVPQLPSEWKHRPILMILTQERLRWLLNDAPEEFSFDKIVIDEAQKIGDGHRGIVLKQALELACERNPKVDVLFSSPNTENPQILFRSKPSGVKEKILVSEFTAVNQNLIYVDQVPGKPCHWELEYCKEGKFVKVGDIEADEKPPSSASLRLPYVARLISRGSGILIYANTASTAESIASYLFDQQLSPQKVDKSVAKLSKLVRQTIHAEYLLAKVLSKGIAFHYGNMPTNIRIEIERLFKDGKIQYLVCTSTLMEGVNLGAKYIFLRGPRRGKTGQLDLVDFWNLAGRAGRLGSDFQGNIVCVDVKKRDTWDFIPPAKKTRFPIKEASDVSADTITELIEYIKDRTPRSQEKGYQFLEYLLSYYTSQILRKDKISIPSSDNQNAGLVLSLEVEIRAMLSQINIPREILERNLGISPFAQADLLEYFQRKENVLELIPIDPKIRDSAKDSYIAVLGRIFTNLSGHSHLLAFPYAILVVSWMSGMPMKAIINRNKKYWERKNKKLPWIIRHTMEEVEEFARFKFAKYSSCYLDLLRFHFIQTNRQELLEKIPKLHMWLEFGASQETQISLMSLGLSRNAAISFSKCLASETLTRDQCAEAIIATSLSKLKIQDAALEELERVKEMLMQQ